MKRITGTDDIAFGHFGTLGYVLSGWIGSLCGKGSRSTEEMNLPKNLSFLRDSSISISDHDDYLSDHGGERGA